MTRTRGTKHRARRTAAQWQELFDRFERTGQTRGRFCAAHGLALSTFDLWRRKLRATPAAVNEERPEAPFVELTNPTQTQARIARGHRGRRPPLAVGATAAHRLSGTQRERATNERHGKATRRRPDTRHPRARRSGRVTVEGARGRNGQQARRLMRRGRT